MAALQIVNMRIVIPT